MGTDLSIFAREKILPLSFLKGKVVSVDASNLLFQLINNPGQRQLGEYYTDRTCRAISHLYGLLYKITGFYKHGIYPLMVFDGKPDELKRKITRDEAHDFKILEDWYRKALVEDDRDRLKSIGFNPFFMWKTVVKEAKQLLFSMGVPIFTAPSEAEAQCAYFTKIGLVNYTISSDYDTLLFGCPFQIRTLNFSGREYTNGKWKTTKGFASVLSLDELLRENRLNLFQLIDVSLLIGNDFFKGISGFGPKHAAEQIRKCGDLLSFFETQQIPKTIRTEAEQARELLLFPIVVEKEPELEWRCPNRGAIKSLLCNDHTLKAEKVEKAIENLLDAFKRKIAVPS